MRTIYFFLFLPFFYSTLVGAESRSRPQNPQPPFPYTCEEVIFENGPSVRLAGTLTLPSPQTLSCAVLLIAGSGPMDRDETLFDHKIFLVLADHLSRQGIAVLRYDKRGVGKSTGNFPQATSKDFASDASAAFAYLKARPELKGKKIGVLGHSEGGMIAPVVAAKNPDVAFIVMMGAPGVTGKEIVLAQTVSLPRSEGVPEEILSEDAVLWKAMVRLLQNEPDLQKADKKLHQLALEHEKKYQRPLKSPYNVYGNRSIEALIQMINTPWFRYFLTFDPLVALSKVKVPILAFWGDKDRTISPAQNIPPIERALKKSHHPDYTILEFPNLNHLFQTCTTGSMEEYERIEETIAPVVLQQITEWTLSRCH